MNWQELLGQEHSELARVGRAALAGLVRTLEMALELAPANDPGGRACRALAAELSRLLTVAAGFQPADSPAGWKPAATAVPVRTEGSLIGLARSLASEPAVRAELGEWNPGDDPAVLWLQLQLALLRLPAPLADRCREQIQRVAGAAINHAALTTLPGEMGEVVFPGFGQPPLQPGVRLDPSGAIDERLGKPPLPPLAQRLAGPITLLLWLTEQDPALHHALRGVYRFGIIGLAGGQKSKFQRALIERFQRLVEVEKGTDVADLVLAWVDLDEAIHALLYLPVPVTSSWWGRTLARVRETMLPLRERAVAVGKAIHLQTLAGRYADVIAFTEPDCDCEAAASVPPGEVVRCLRVFLRMDGVAHKGRVLYRSR